MIIINIIIVTFDIIDRHYIHRNKMAASDGTVNSMNLISQREHYNITSHSKYNNDIENLMFIITIIIVITIIIITITIMTVKIISQIVNTICNTIIIV